MEILRILVVGRPDHVEKVTTPLLGAGHSVVSVEALADAIEALLVQRFDAVLLGADVSVSEIKPFAERVKELDSRSSSKVRTAVLALEAARPGSGSKAGEGAETARESGIDGFLCDTSDPDTLTLEIARLASAVGLEPVNPTSSRQPDAVILDVDRLKEQVAYDDELLVELIDLFLSERLRQSAEMRQALADGDHEQLSRIAHTIRGSLGSLQATLATAHAQTLEIAAKNHEDEKCRNLLPPFEDQLDVLEERLLALRRSIAAS